MSSSSSTTNRRRSLITASTRRADQSNNLNISVDSALRADVAAYGFDNYDFDDDDDDDFEKVAAREGGFVGGAAPSAINMPSLDSGSIATTRSAAATGYGPAHAVAWENRQHGYSSSNAKATRLDEHTHDFSASHADGFGSTSGLSQLHEVSFSSPHSNGYVTRTGGRNAGYGHERAKSSVHTTGQTLRSYGGASAAVGRKGSMSRLVSWIPRSWPVRLFILITLIEAGIDIAVEAVLLSRFHTSYGDLLRYGAGAVSAENGDGNGKSSGVLPVFVMVFCFAHVYQFGLACDAVANRNTVLVIGLLAFNLMFLVYALIQISEIRNVLGDGVVPGTSQKVPVQVLTGSIPFVIGAACLAYVPLSWLLWKEFGWLHFKSLGADRVLKKAHMQYQIFVALLKFDFFVFIAFCLQLVLVVLNSDDAERWLTFFAAPFSLLILVFAWFSVRHELVWGMASFMVGLVGAAAYFIYKLFRIWQQKDGAYEEVYKSLTVFSVLALSLLAATAVMSVRCMMNFGKGLKAAFDRAKQEKALLKAHARGMSSSESHALGNLYSAGAGSSTPGGLSLGRNGSTAGALVGMGAKKNDGMPLTSSSTLVLNPRMSLD